MTRHPYRVRLPVFEGPLDLLLHLIRTRKLDIRDIPIAVVTEQYLEYLALMEWLDLELGSEFLVMAATLMEIKSRMLLPRPEPVAGEEDSAADPRAELVARLLEYERYREIAAKLQERAEAAGLAFPRQPVERWEGGTPLVELTPRDLLEALRRLHAPTDGNGHAGRMTVRLRRRAVPLRERIAEVLRLVRTRDGPVPFSELLRQPGRRADRPEIVVLFLAILELVRRGEISAWQHAVGEEIYLLPRDRPPTPAPAA